MMTARRSANLYQRLLLPLPIISGVAILFVYLLTPNIVENIVRNNALDNAANLLANLRAAQDYYAKNVVKKALSIPGVEVSHIHLGVDNTIPIPATFLLEMTQDRPASQSSIRVVSPFPFKNRLDRKLDKFQVEAWDQLAVNTNEQRVILNRSAERSTFRIADAFTLTSEVCVACHNSHPDSPKNDWQVGDLRGVIDMEIDVTEQFARGEILSQLIVSFFVITTIVYVLVNYLTARAVVSPITQITNAFRSYIKGEKDIALPRRGSQEVQHLSDAFAAFRQSDDERQRLVKELEKKAFIDAVTGLSNREGFLHRLSQMTESNATNKPKTAAIAIFDLDHFQDVNNTSGHAVGDQLIAALTERLIAEFPSDVEFARLGPDEFGAIFNDIAEHDVPALRTRIEDMRRQIGMPVEVNDTKYKVTVSVGSAMFPGDGSDVRALVTATDIALNQAKKRGRDQYVAYSRELSDKVVNRIGINTSIRDALGHNQFMPFYQAQLDLETGEVIGAEALVRWLKPDGTIVPPGVFLPVAEQSKLIAEIGAEVLYKSCQQIVEWEKSGIYLKRIAVNLSAVQLADPALLFYHYCPINIHSNTI